MHSNKKRKRIFRHTQQYHHLSLLFQRRSEESYFSFLPPVPVSQPVCAKEVVKTDMTRNRETTAAAHGLLRHIHLPLVRYYYVTPPGEKYTIISGGHARHTHTLP